MKIDQQINMLNDWKGDMLSRIRALMLEADPEAVEEIKWAKPSKPGIPVWSDHGIITTFETYKDTVKMTFARGASLPDPNKLFNASLEGNTRRAIDIREREEIDEEALKALIVSAAELNRSQCKS